MTIARLAAVPLLVLLAGQFVAQDARADEVKLISAAAVKGAMADLPALAASRQGNIVRFDFGTAGGVRDLAIADPTFDIAIVPPAMQAELARRGLIVDASATPLGTVNLGLSVASDKPAPSLTSVDDLRRALMDASSIGMADPAKGATSGIFLDKLMETLGIKDAVKSKLKLFPDGQAAMEAAARHEVALAVGQTSEAMPVPGLNPAVLLPDAAQLKTTYVATLSSHAAHPDAARQLLTLLGSPDMADKLRKAGFVAGAPSP
jgi:molybdate transport system substrate-binding protein